ncbi:MAG: DUF6688 family protein [Lachnospiraceae bacterium]|nr:DUF6688 family protein [Lachnospiraceae bacterium]
MKKIRKLIINHPYGSQILICLLGGLAIGLPMTLFTLIREVVKYHIEFGEFIFGFFEYFWITIIICICMAFPVVFTVFEMMQLFAEHVRNNDRFEGRFLFFKELAESAKSVFGAVYELVTLLFGVLLEYILLAGLHNVRFDAQWSEELRNSELHAPINPDYMLTFAVMCVMFAIGYLVWAFTSSQKRPPLLTVLCFSAMYVGVIESILFTIHIMGMNYTYENCVKNYCFTSELLYTLLIPLNMLLILVRVLLHSVKTHETDPDRSSKVESNAFLSACNRILNNAKYWPLLALLFMIPLLGILTMILALFGQAPDAAIKAFSETANYTFSTKIPPQNVFYDEHYLCTVAAGGHRRVVKPIRMGRRHGHDVVVNRQLMVANAFEQILEEKTPTFHKHVRGFYDRYGFPIARLIKSKYVADIIWFIMKPLEWFFLFVIYLVDEYPEDRIARQYL